MSVVMSALHTVQTATAHAAIAIAAQNGQEFDPNKVTPGPEGFIATAVFAAAVITLGFLLVKRLRRNGYRSEIREEIAAELAETGTTTAGGSTSESGSADAGGADGSGAVPDSSGSRPDGS